MNAHQRRSMRKLKRRYYDSLIAQKSYWQTTSRKTIKFYRDRGLNVSEEYHRMPHEVDMELIASFANSDPDDTTGTHRFVVYGTNDLPTPHPFPHNPEDLQTGLRKVIAAKQAPKVTYAQELIQR